MAAPTSAARVKKARLTTWKVTATIMSLSHGKKMKALFMNCRVFLALAWAPRPSVNSVIKPARAILPAPAAIH
jgi:hypothetical protein